jgi:phosphohistidine swiveling domain-containing protein
MKYIRGHINKNLDKWLNKQWYHQRFDGSPYFMHLIAEGEIERHPERKKGGDFSVHFCFYENGKADWYILMDDIKRVTDAVISESKKNPNISSDFIKLWQKDQEVFYKKCFEVGKIELSKLSDKELIKVHDEFMEIALNKNSSSSIIDGFALGTDEMIADKIKEAYENSTVKNEMRFTEVFSQLTAPVHLSFVNEAEIGLLKLAVETEKDGLKEVFLKNNAGEIKEKIKGTKALGLLGNHQKNFFWIRNNYVSSFVLDAVYFIGEIKKLFEMRMDMEGELNKVKNTPGESRKKKSELIKKLNLSQELKTLIKISEDFTYWQDERKKSTMWNMHYFSLILAEIGKRAGIETEYLKYMTPREVSSIFSNKPNVSDLKARQKNGVYYWDKNGMDAVHSEEANYVRGKVLGKMDMSDVDDFRGLTACLGKAVGKVKIVKSATEIGKVEKGDILVAVMTRPDYVPAMKKAAAIVTDEGGVTCHAAIVSRELGIPCIIGTRIATKVLKDNILVEVNANHGWVKIIRK